MQTGNSIIMHAPREFIFETAADLAQWPRILPHYRYIRFLERVRNAASSRWRRSAPEFPFLDLRVCGRSRADGASLFASEGVHPRDARGLDFKETPAGVLVEIMHVLRFRVAALAPMAEPIIGGFFIHHVANQTLQAMKTHVETSAAPASQRA